MGEEIGAEVVKVFEQSLDEAEAEAPIRWSEKDSREGAVAQARSMLEVWLKWPRPEAKILAVEESFEIELAPWLPKLVGRVDPETGELILVDLKTSRTRWGEEQIHVHANIMLSLRPHLASSGIRGP